tara:strand:+ start:2876 stop:3169 length:294 start_codon:yes stop_codon:yes gene_type:complete
MSTATAHATRPLVFKPFKVELELVKALPEDFRKLKEWGQDGAPIYERKIGMVYWLYSHSKNQIEPTPYIIDEHTDAEELRDYLKAEMVYISKCPFKN